MHPQRVALCGFYAKNNFGDDLMAEHLSKVLGSDGRCSVELYSDVAVGSVKNGAATGEHLGCDVVVIGGGGLVSPSFWALKGEHLASLAASGKKVAFINVNVTDDHMSDSAFVEQLHSLNAVWWVRDEASVVRLSALGMNVKYVPDVSLRRGVVPAHKTIEGGKTLAVFLNSYALNDLGCNDDVGRFLKGLNTLKVIAQHLDWMAHWGWKTTLYSAHTAHEVDDRIPAAVVFGMMRKKGAARWVAEPMPHDALVSAIAESDLVLSMRYHSSIIAVASGVPFVDITHHAKNLNMLKQLSMEDVSIPYGSVSHEQLVVATQRAETQDLNRAAKLATFREHAHVCWERFDQEWASFIGT